MPASWRRVQRQGGAVQLELTLMGQPEKPGDEAPGSDENGGAHLSLFQPPTASLQKAHQGQRRAQTGH